MKGRTRRAALVAGSLASLTPCTMALGATTDGWPGPTRGWFGGPKLSTYETVNVIEGETNNGLATLIRRRNDVHLRISTTALEPNSAYTVWIAAFNRPGMCEEDCNGPDLPAADGSVFLGTTFVTGGAGTVNVDFDLQTGGLPFGTYVFNGHGGGIRWGNGFEVELHVILSLHGPSADIADWPSKLLVPGELPGEQVAQFK